MCPILSLWGRVVCSYVDRTLKRCTITPRSPCWTHKRVSTREMFPLGLQASPTPNLKRRFTNFSVWLVRFLPSKQTEAFMDLINVWALCVRSISEKAHHAHDIAVKTDTNIISRGSAGEMKEMPVWQALSAHQKDGEDLSLLRDTLLLY